LRLLLHISLLLYIDPFCGLKTKHTKPHFVAFVHIVVLQVYPQKTDLHVITNMDKLVKIEFATLVCGALYVAKSIFVNATKYLMASSSTRCEDVETVPYDYFNTHAKTGDILLAASTGILSTGTRILSQSQWTHAGLVCRCVTKDNKNIICEFGAHNPTELVYNTMLSATDQRFVLGDGVGIYDIDTYITNYTGLYWYPLTDVSDEIRVKIRDVMQRMLLLRNTEYSPEFAGAMEIMTSILPPSDWVSSTFSTRIWCSTVVALVLQSVGVLSMTKDISTYMPSDFGNQHTWLPTCPSIRLAPYYVMGAESGAIRI
jgi:hypothetical protein